MKFKLKCKSNPNHKRFVTVVQVNQEWEVDMYGEYKYVKESCVDVIDESNEYECLDCGCDEVIKIKIP